MVFFFHYYYFLLKERGLHEKRKQLPKLYFIFTSACTLIACAQETMEFSSEGKNRDLGMCDDSNEYYDITPNKYTHCGRRERSCKQNDGESGQCSLRFQLRTMDYT